jgi:hypothetical protein
VAVGGWQWQWDIRVRCGSAVILIGGKLGIGGRVAVGYNRRVCFFRAF